MTHSHIGANLMSLKVPYTFASWAVGDHTREA
jgi:hypothetical protein